MEVDFSALDSVIGSLGSLETLPDHVQDSMLHSMADVVVSAQKRKAEAMGIRRTGTLIASIGKDNKTGRGSAGRFLNVYAKGSRRRGNTVTTNAKIAFVNEYGKRGQPGRPFISEANEECADEVAAAGMRILNDYLSSKNL